MARITWLGEGGDSPSTITWFGRELRAGEAIELEDARLIAKAKGSRFFKVEEHPVTQWREPAAEADPADADEDEEPHPVPHRPAAKPKHRPVKHR